MACRYVYGRHLGLLISLVLLTIVGCSKSPQQLINDAKMLEAKGDRVGAIINLRAAVQLEPDNAAFRYLLGRLYNANYQPDDAENELIKAKQRGYLQEGRTIVELARSLRAQGKFEEMLKKCGVDKEFAPSARAALIALRGRSQHALFRPDDAKKSYEESVALEVGNTDARVLKAQIQAGEGDLKAALATLEELLKANPELYDALVPRAELLRLMERPDDALDGYTQILKHNPREMRALIMRATLLIEKGELGEAQKTVSALMAARPGDPAAILQRGILELAQGRSQDALTSALDAMKDAPDFAEAKFLAGLAHFSLRHYAQAQEFLSKALVKLPNSTYGRRILAESYLLTSQPTQALEVIQPILDARIEDPKIFALAGDCYLRTGDNAKAMEWFNKAASAGADDPQYKVGKALAKLRTGERETGLAELGDVLALTKEASRADEVLVMLLLSRKQVEKAQDAISKLQKRDPSSALTRNLAGLVAVAKHDKKVAAVEFEAALKKEPSFYPAAENLARLDIADGELDRARQRFEVVIAADNKSVPSYIAIAQLELRRKRTKEAIDALKRGLKKVPNALPAQMLLTSLYLSNGSNQQAIDSAEAALAAYPRNAEVISFAAQTELVGGNAIKSVETYERLLDLYPNSEDVVTRVAEFESNAGQFRQAEAILRKSLAGHPSSKLQIALVSFLVSQKRFDDAGRFAQNIQKTQPKAPIGWVLMGEVLEASHKSSEAISAYDSALALQPAGPIAVKRFQVRRQADPSKALAELEAWSAQHPGDVATLARIGDTYLEAENFKRAAASYEAIILTKQVPLEVVNNLAWCYFKLKDERALSLAQSAVSAAPNAASALDTYGWILLDKGKTKEAVEVLKRAATVDAENLDIGYHLAAALAKAGDRAAARELLTKITKGDKPFASAKDASALLASLK